MKPYTDRKGRPELIVNPAIKLGLASFRPQQPDATVVDGASTPPPSRRRSRAKKKPGVVDNAPRRQSVDAPEPVQPPRPTAPAETHKTSRTAERRNPPPKKKGMAPPQPVHLQ